MTTQETKTTVTTVTTVTTATTATTDAPSIADELAAAEASIIDHFNAFYPDAVAVVCRAHTGRDDLTATALAGLSLESLALRATAADGSVHEAMVPFSRPVATLNDLHPLAIEVTTAARTSLGITELTSAEIEDQKLHAIRTHITSVVRVEQLTPSFRQITFGGGDLTSFQPGGLDQFIYVLAPPPGRTELTIDASFSWDDYGQMPDDERPIGAYYTLRRWRPDVAEIDMLFVLHGVADRHGEPGPTARWAAKAEPGDPVALWGPRTAYEPPADTDWLLLAGDETGLPAISVILEHLPAGTPAHVFVELGDDADRLALPESPDIHVTWLIRGDAPAGTTTLLIDAVRALDLPDGKVYAWGGAESRTMTQIRKYLRRERGFERTQVCMVGYWRHASTSDADAFDTEDA
ncbi:siderophore-interacting protein [Desertimonas flava]|uniref:siderophore-interacting protein n=1 Tax=Desertimonas flava TaxID=2064846 RepID=UPI000E354D20|nr:siderophore-interacting protein [Desertimonas flava]